MAINMGTPHIVVDDSDEIQLKRTSKLGDKQDFYVGAGLRGLRSHHIRHLN